MIRQEKMQVLPQPHPVSSTHFLELGGGSQREKEPLEDV